MNKPIIIDGVDVSECEFKSLFDNRCCSFADDTENLNCNNKDCYYKQLQRMKAENMELFKECENDKKRVYSMKVLSDKYKQALEDVREITKKYYLSDKKLLATGIMINPYYAIIEIQNKINEVLKSENHKSNDY